MAKIFISYRRADSAAFAGRIYDRLAHRYGRKNLFKDVDDIPPGTNFKEYIQQSLRQCAVKLLIIGRGWLATQSPNGSRRLNDPADPVRIEIETAFALGLIVIPVLVDGADIPDAADLPESLQPLVFINAVSVRNDPDFNHDMERLIAAIDVATSGRPRRPSGSVDLGRQQAASISTTMPPATVGPASLHRPGTRRTRIAIGVATVVAIIAMLGSALGVIAAASGALRCLGGCSSPVMHPVRWQAEIGPTDAGPVVVGDIVLATTLEGKIYALHTADGSVAWSFATNGRFDAAPVVDGDTIIDGSEDNGIYALAKDGTLLWRYSVDARIATQLAVANDMLYATVVDHQLYAFRLGCPQGPCGVAWKYVMPAIYNSGPAVANGIVYVAASDPSHGVYALVALDGRTGRVLWKTPLQGAAYAPPTVVGDTVYVRDNLGVIYAVDAATHTVAWSYPTHNAITQFVVVSGDSAYFDADKHFAYALRMVDQTKRWDYDINGLGAALAVNGQTVYVSGSNASHHHELLALDTGNGGLRWEAPMPSYLTGGAQVHNGMVFVMSAAGWIFALDA